MNDANIIIQRTDESSVPVTFDEPAPPAEAKMLVERPAAAPQPPPKHT